MHPLLLPCSWLPGGEKHFIIHNLISNKMDNNYLTKPEGGDPLNFARQVLQSFQNLMVNYDDMAARLEQSEARNRELEQENERLLGEQQKNGSWASRVTYENVVELIASYEDASQRDEARKLIEPLLKKEQVRQLRRDIKKKMKELEAAEEPAEETETPQVPEELQTEEAEEIWAGLREGGFIVANGYGLAKDVSANQATYIADRMAERLGISLKWKVFQKLWNIRNMAQLAASWKETGKLPPRADEIDRLT